MGKQLAHWPRSVCGVKETEKAAWAAGASWPDGCTLPDTWVGPQYALRRGFELAHSLGTTDQFGKFGGFRGYR
jgi:hypothetical protein